jgi:hypothetical protein
MTLADCIAALLKDRDDAVAWGAVDAELAAIGRRGGVIPAFRDDAVGMARLALLALLDDGGLADVHQPPSYFYCIVRNASISLHRRERAEAKKAERAHLVETQPAAEPGLSADAVFALIRRVTPSALAARPADRRTEIAASIERMLDMAANGRRTADVVDAVAEREGLTLDAPGDRARLIDTIDRRHTRARGYLLDAVERLVRRGDLAPEEAADAREAVRLLRRRQETPPRASPG